jgi:hypothetical protein
MSLVYLGRFQAGLETKNIWCRAVRGKSLETRLQDVSSHGEHYSCLAYNPRATAYTRIDARWYYSQ